MGKQHLIDELHFATELDQAVTALAPWSDWPDFCRHRLLGVIDKVFDEFSPPGTTTLRLDSLEVDLGPLSSTLSAEELEKHLEQCLRESLRDSLRNAEQGTVTADAQSAADERSEQATLEFYLQHGLPPWHADQAATYQLEVALIEQAGQDRERIKTLLQTSERALERSIRQLTDAALGQLLALLAPGRIASLQKLTAAARQADDRETRYRLWQRAFRQALTESIIESAEPQGIQTKRLMDTKSEPAGPAPTPLTVGALSPARETGMARMQPGTQPLLEASRRHHLTDTNLPPNSDEPPRQAPARRAEFPLATPSHADTPLIRARHNGSLPGMPRPASEAIRHLPAIFATETETGPGKNGISQMPAAPGVVRATADTTTENFLPQAIRGKNSEMRNGSDSQISPTVPPGSRPRAPSAGASSNTAPTPTPATAAQAKKMPASAEVTRNSPPAPPARGAKTLDPSPGRPGDGQTLLPLAASSNNAPRLQQATPGWPAAHQTGAVDMASESRQSISTAIAAEISAKEDLAAPSPSTNAPASGDTAGAKTAISKQLVAGQSRTLSGPTDPGQTAAHQAADSEISAPIPLGKSFASPTRDTHSGRTSHPLPAYSGETVAEQSQALSTKAESRPEAAQTVPAGNATNQGAIAPPGNRQAESEVSTREHLAVLTISGTDNTGLGCISGAKPAIPDQVASGPSRTLLANRDSKPGTMTNVAPPGLVDGPSPIRKAFSRSAASLPQSETSAQTAATTFASTDSEQVAAPKPPTENLAAGVSRMGSQGDDPGSSTADAPAASEAGVQETAISGQADEQSPSLGGAVNSQQNTAPTKIVAATMASQVIAEGSGTLTSTDSKPGTLPTPQPEASAPGIFVIEQAGKGPGSSTADAPTASEAGIRETAKSGQADEQYPSLGGAANSQQNAAPTEIVAAAMAGQVTAGRSGTLTSTDSKPGALPTVQPEASATGVFVIEQAGKEPGSSNADAPTSSEAGIRETAKSGQADEQSPSLGGAVNSQQNTAPTEIVAAAMADQVTAGASGMLTSTDSKPGTLPTTQPEASATGVFVIKQAGKEPGSPSADASAASEAGIRETAKSGQADEQSPSLGGAANSQQKAAPTEIIAAAMAGQVTAGRSGTLTSTDSKQRALPTTQPEASATGICMIEQTDKEPGSSTADAPTASEAGIRETAKSGQADEQSPSLGGAANSQQKAAPTEIIAAAMAGQVTAGRSGTLTSTDSKQRALPTTQPEASATGICMIEQTDKEPGSSTADAPTSSEAGIRETAKSGQTDEQPPSLGRAANSQQNTAPTEIVAAAMAGQITNGGSGTLSSTDSKQRAIPIPQPEASATGVSLIEQASKEPGRLIADAASRTAASGESAKSAPTDEGYRSVGSPAKNRQNTTPAARDNKAENVAAKTTPHPPGQSETLAEMTGNRPGPAASPNTTSKGIRATTNRRDTAGAVPGDLPEHTKNRPETKNPVRSLAEQAASERQSIKAAPGTQARSGASDGSKVGETPPVVSEQPASTPQSAARTGVNPEQATPPVAPRQSSDYWKERVQERVQGEFARAIERHAGQAMDQARYYRLLLAALAAEAPIDPAAIAAQSGAPGDDDNAATVAEPADARSMPGDAPPPPAEPPIASLPPPGWIEPLLASGSSALGLVVVPLLADQAKLPGLLSIWPDELFERVFAQLRNPDFDRLLSYAEAMSEACSAITGDSQRRLKWQALADALFPRPRYGATADFVVASAERLAAASPEVENFRAALCANLSGKPEQQRIEQYLRYWLLGSKAPEPAGPAEVNPAAIVPGSGLVIGNAGQVLAAPYLPRLFDMLGLLDKGRFAGLAEARRACHLLQFMVDPQSEAAEHQLLLNKLLCGLNMRQPLDAGIEVSEQEKTLIEGLLQGIISNWGALGSTSIAGLREAFLQRSGVLAYRDEAWQLKVEKKTLDILMERLPWSFSIIRHSWMKQAVMVDWL